ncbi:YcxB family protein [Streptomyces sp. NPDC005955]|uniref:YcxB family protein n=1 Tax=Streptomyces sp. NPDC005955 TaxID=3364738 RepID=UPI003699A0F0
MDEATQSTGSTAPVVGERIELRYELVAKDFQEALAERAKAIPSARRTQLGVMAVCWAAGGALPVSLLAGDEPVWWLFALVAAVFVAVLVLVVQGWSYGRMHQRAADYEGPLHAVLDEESLTFTGDHTQIRARWSSFGRYRETRRSFVLFLGDRNGAGFSVLPKAGVQRPEDVDRLRELLDRRLHRA